MSSTTAEIVRADQEHLIHPLHHPVDNANTVIYVSGRGVTVEDIDGHEYLDGLSGLWNVNVGHGRAELAEAAARQMTMIRTRRSRLSLAALAMRKVCSPGESRFASWLRSVRPSARRFPRHR